MAGEARNAGSREEGAVARRSRATTVDRLRQVDLSIPAAVFAGGAAGALLRAGMAELAPADPGRWPWTTFALNVAGSLLLGYFATRLQERLPPGRYGRPLLGTGFCGALTTFSTMQVEAFRLARDGHSGLAAAYVLATAGAGLVAVVLAVAATRRARLA